ncbi:MAG: 16S rRNA (adenine(1518)-N(6)/adenine(1519)-N(6))-dimethyltransferase RsmA [Burkholderiaceae bacterium]|nr:16S rRNA (adenine(1518)-N(6)/adenine(1519)-N(6))-dimethyltransferase RsmA [Burkholderiaceae bacterium]
MRRSSPSRPAPARRTRGGVLARRRFGQHFLVDKGVIHAIVEAIGPRSDDAIVEIGPGPGALTDALLARIGHIDAIEIDRDLAAALTARHGADRLSLHQADVLGFDWRGFAGDRRLRIVGNLPYNISTPLLLGLADVADIVVDQHFMLQKEVVARIVAGPGGADYGRLGILLQARYECDWLFDVPPESFDPPPRVDSAVLRMTPRPARVRSMSALSELLAVAFGQRRKMLRGHLLPWLRERGIEDETLEPTRRAEEIDQETWYRVADRLAESRLGVV